MNKSFLHYNLKIFTNYRRVSRIFSLTIVSCLLSSNSAISATRGTSISPSGYKSVSKESVDAAIKFFTGGPSQVQVSSTCPTTPQPTKLVKLIVTGNFKNVNRVVRVRKYAESTDTPSNPSNNMSQPSINGHQETRFDLDLSGLWNGDEYIAVKVILRDPEVTFWGSDLSITTTDSISAAMICGLQTRLWSKDEEENASKPSREFAKFYVRNTGTPGLVGSFNILLFIRDSDPRFNLPVIIDPKVRNDG